MNRSLAFLLFPVFMTLVQCKSTGSENEPTTESSAPELAEQPENVSAPEPSKEAPDQDTPSNDIPSDWSELTGKEGFQLDIRYATTKNFTNKKIYDCGKCFLRPEAAEKVRAIQKELKETYGYGIKLFDCYRPRPYQQRLWDIVPDPDYVTPPQKGSMHSRGLAVDLTFTDAKGKELDMGTPFDFFGEKAHHAFEDLPEEVLKNRALLKSTMEKYGFNAITTEWWHYSMNIAYPLDNWLWPCEQ